jgi:preprotein translocase subunit SecF
MAALFIFAANALVLRQIASILLIGLTADLLNTWVLNANILLWRQK